VQAEVVQQVQVVLESPVPLLQAPPLEPQVEAQVQESLVSTEARLLPPPPLQPLLPP